MLCSLRRTLVQQSKHYSTSCPTKSCIVHAENFGNRRKGRTLERRFLLSETTLHDTVDKLQEFMRLNNHGDRILLRRLFSDSSLNKFLIKNASDNRFTLINISGNLSVLNDLKPTTILDTPRTTLKVTLKEYENGNKKETHTLTNESAKLFPLHTHIIRALFYTNSIDYLRFESYDKLTSFEAHMQRRTVTIYPS